MIHEWLGSVVIDACNRCAEICRNCARESASMPDMDACVRLCTECSVICERIALAPKDVNDADIAECSAACRDCAAECRRHDHGHCQLCAETCLECETYFAELNPATVIR